MRITLKASLTAIMLTSVAAVPLATATTFLTADAAYAKSDKAKGKGGGKSGSKAKGKSGSKGKSGDRSASKGGGHGGLDGFLGKLTGKDKKAKKTTRGGGKKTMTAAATMEEVVDCGGEGQDECTPEFRQLHPSELGKMNGALNANENAILAHIRNGNMSNGPVGLMAGYAYHSAGTAEARELLGSGTAEEYQEYQDALAAAGNAMTTEEYASWVEEQMALPEDERDPDLMEKMIAVETAQANLGSSNLDDALGDFASYDDYLAATYNEDGTLIEGAEANEDLEDAFASLGNYDADTAQALEAAGGDVQAYDDALAALYDSWNKGDADSENADDLKAMLDARVGEYTEVEALYEEMNPADDGEMAGDEEIVGCDEGVEDCVLEDEELAAAE